MCLGRSYSISIGPPLLRTAAKFDESGCYTAARHSHIMPSGGDNVMPTVRSGSVAWSATSSPSSESELETIELVVDRLHPCEDCTNKLAPRNTTKRVSCTVAARNMQKPILTQSWSGTRLRWRSQEKRRRSCQERFLSHIQRPPPVASAFT